MPFNVGSMFAPRIGEAAEPTTAASRPQRDQDAGR
jgi:hypothetical protein